RATAVRTMARRKRLGTSIFHPGRVPAGRVATSVRCWILVKRAMAAAAMMTNIMIVPTEKRIRWISRMASPSGSIPIDLAAMSDAQDQYDQLVIPDCIDDPIGTHAEAVEVVLPLELDRPVGPRIRGQLANMLTNPVSLGLREFLELPESGIEDLNAVAA